MPSAAAEHDPHLSGRLRSRRANERLPAEAVVLPHVAERRFGPLPAGTRERVAAAGIESIDRCPDRILEAASLDDLLPALPPR